MAQHARSRRGEGEWKEGAVLHVHQQRAEKALIVPLSPGVTAFHSGCDRQELLTHGYGQYVPLGILPCAAASTIFPV